MAVGFPVKANYVTGEVLTAANMNDLSGTLNTIQSVEYAAGKNKIINGDFRINQRNFSSTTTTSTFGFDRWQILIAGTGTTTYSAQTFTAGAAPVAGYEAVNFARVVTTGQTGTNPYSILAQNIEDVRTLAGQTVTVSFWAKAASGTPKIAVDLTQNFGSGGSAEVNNYAGQATLTTSWARYSVTTTLPSISGKTIGTSSLLGAFLWVSAGTDLNSRTGSIGIQTNTFDIWGVQVEASSTASDFATATGTIQGELAACQRYYYLHVTGNSQSFANAANFSASQMSAFINFPVTMRTTPTLSATSGTDYYSFSRNGGSDTINSLTINTPATSGAEVYNDSQISGTAGHAGILKTNNASAAVAFSAEL